MPDLGNFLLSITNFELFSLFIVACSYMALIRLIWKILGGNNV